MKTPARNVSSERARELSQKQSKVLCNMKTPSLQVSEPTPWPRSGNGASHVSNGANRARTSALSLAEEAQRYRDNHHFVPLRLQGKDPAIMGMGWQKRTLASPLPDFQDGDNIGFLLGEPSGWVVRIDPDFATVPGVVDLLYPEVTATFGRASAPCSGRLYVCEGQKSKDFRLPNSMKDDQRLRGLRGGCQSDCCGRQ
jgi:hypothetical protein